MDGDGELPAWAADLALQRAERGWSQRDLARRLRAEGGSRGERLPRVDHLIRAVRRWETGQVRPSKGYRRLLTAALDPESGERLTAVAGRRARVDLPAVDALAALVHHYRQADDTAPTGSLAGAVGAVADVAADLAAAADTGRQQQAAGRVLAEAERQRWWTYVDLGLTEQAEVAYGRALAAATEAGYLPFVAHLLAGRAGHALSRGDLTTAVRLARHARDPRYGLSPAGLAWAATHEVRAHLSLGSPVAELRRATDAAQAAYAAVRAGDEPAWLYWLAGGPILRLEALDIRLVIEGPDVAGEVEEALTGLPAERSRDHAWYRASLATARARAGDVEGAVVDAAAAVALAGATGSTWPLVELRQLARLPGLSVLGEVLADCRA